MVIPGADPNSVSVSDLKYLQSFNSQALGLCPPYGLNNCLVCFPLFHLKLFSLNQSFTYFSLTWVLEMLIQEKLYCIRKIETQDNGRNFYEQTEKKYLRKYNSKGGLEGKYK